MGFLDSITGRFSSWNIAGTAITFGVGIACLLSILIIGFFVWKWWKNKNTYIQPIRLIRLLENGSKKENNNLKGGKIEVNGITDFEIKMKGMKKLRLGYIPDYSYMDADGRLVFITLGDGKAVQQIKETIITEKVVEGEDENGEKVSYRYNLIAEPVPTDIKQSTLNSLRSWREILDKKKITVWAIGIGMFIIMVIAHLVSLYIQTKVKCPIPTP